MSNDKIKGPVGRCEEDCGLIIDNDDEIVGSVDATYRDEIIHKLNGYGVAVTELKYLLTMWEGDNDPSGHRDGLIQTLKDLGELDEQEDKP